MTLPKISSRSWYKIHKWSSLVCTVFLLIICLTGLPLIFGEEIDHWLSTDPPYAQLPADTPMANLDTLVTVARKRYPGEIIRSVFIDDEAPQVRVTLAPGIHYPPDLNHSLQFDARTGQVLKDEPPEFRQPNTFMGVMFALHTDLFLKLPGELFLGVMGLLFVAAIISGIVLYGPFMNKLPFGTVRAARSARIKWLDLHNLLGVATLTWALIIGLTGVLNELSIPMFGLWLRNDVGAMLEPYRGKPPLQPNELSSVQSAYDAVKRMEPGRLLTSMVYPGNPFGSPRHYLAWTKGDTPLTRRIFKPVLVDAQSGELIGEVHMPWYLRALEVSRPLHFGDYGGVPLKILWAVLDLITVIVLGSGLYLWAVRGRSRQGLQAKLTQPHRWMGNPRET